MAKKKPSTGVFSDEELNEAIGSGVITATEPIEEGQVQPASIDLRLGTKVYRLVSSFLPENEGVLDKLHQKDMYGTDLVMYEMDMGEDGKILEKDSVYLIPLMESLKLPRGVGGKANPKSTTGRLDIFTRIITDKNPRFDEIKDGYKGGLFLEIMPRSFTVKVKAGQSLVQLRLRRGNCLVGDAQLKRLNTDTGILYDGKDKVSNANGNIISNGIFMSVDLKGDKSGIIGYKSKKNSHVVDLSNKDHYNIEDFWEPIYNNGKNTLILEPEEFYILASKEKIRIPGGYASEMLPFEAGSGELRTHYAGFFDPGFGYGKRGEVRGTQAVLEVRAHDVPFMIAHGQTLFKLFFEKMSKTPKNVYGPKIGSSYQYQTITLSKQFKKKA